MSWDIFVMNLPAGIKSIDDIPDDFVGAPLGRRADIIAKISALYPTCDFTDPSWGILDLGDCAVEFSLGAREEVQSFAMHVRGGPPAPEIVAHILAELGMRLSIHRRQVASSNIRLQPARSRSKAGAPFPPMSARDDEAERQERG